MFSRLEKIFMPLAAKIATNKYLNAIRDGFLVSTPLLICGSVFLIIANFPIKAWGDFLAKTVVNKHSGITLETLLSKPADASFTIMAVLAVLGIGYSFAKAKGVKPVFGAAVSVMSWFLLMPYVVSGPVIGSKSTEVVSISGISLGWLGSQGIFVGIICAFVSVNLYAFAQKRHWVIKMPAGVPPMVVDSFAALIPAGFSMVIFFLVNFVFSIFGTNAFEFIFKLLQVPLQNLGNTVWAMLIAYLFLHIFWFFGLNGGSIVGAVFNPILLTLSVGNVEYFTKHIGHPNIINQQFQDLFATFGGAGSTLSLLVAMLLICRSQRIRELGKLAIVPGIFGINEPIVFGLPIVLNPMIVIPFILVPSLNIAISYVLMMIHWVPVTSGVYVPWTTPPIISGFLATNWAGALLQLALIVMGALIYMPFIKIMDNQYLKDEQEAEQGESSELSAEELSFDNL